MARVLVILRWLWKHPIAFALSTLAASIAGTGGAVLSESKLEFSSCMQRREFAFFGVFAYRYDTFNEQCSAANAAVELSKTKTSRGSPDLQMQLFALNLYRESVPEIRRMIDAFVALDPEATAYRSLLACIPRTAASSPE